MIYKKDSTRSLVAHKKLTLVSELQLYRWNVKDTLHTHTKNICVKKKSKELQKEIWHLSFQFWNMEIGLIIYMYKEDKNGKNTLRIPNAEITFANLSGTTWPDLTLCENQSEELTVWSCISGVHDLQKTQIHALGWFIKNLRQKRHGGWLSIQVSIITTVNPPF